MSDIDVIYEEGQEAAWAGLQESDCPYQIGSDEAMSWNDGFNDPRSNA
jgi:hypothetical protein